MNEQDATTARPGGADEPRGVGDHLAARVRQAEAEAHEQLAEAQERLDLLTAQRRAAEEAIAALERRRRSLIEDLVRLRETCDVDPGSAALSIDLTGSSLLKRYPA